MKKIVVLLAMVGLIAGILTPAIASAGTTAVITITATPSYLCETITYFDGRSSTWALGTVAENTSYWWDDTTIMPSFPLAIADTAGNLTNCGSILSDVDVTGTNFTGGVGWTLASAGGVNAVELTAYYEGIATEGAGIEVTTGTQELIDSLAAGASKGVELRLETGTFTDGTAKSGTVTYTIRAHT